MEVVAHRKISPHVLPFARKALGDLENGVVDCHEVETGRTIQEKVCHPMKSQSGLLVCLKKMGGRIDGKPTLIPYDEHDVDLFRIILLAKVTEDGKHEFSRPYLAPARRKGMTESEKSEVRRKIKALIVAGWWDIPSAILAEKGYLTRDGRDGPDGEILYGKKGLIVYPSFEFIDRHSELKRPNHPFTDLWTQAFFHEPQTS